MLAASRDRYAYGSHIPTQPRLRSVSAVTVLSSRVAKQLFTSLSTDGFKGSAYSICDSYGYAAAKTEQGGNGSVRITDC